MSRFEWTGRDYSYGVDRGVLYLPDNSGIQWNGLTEVSVEEEGSTGELRYNDGIPYYYSSISGDYSASVSAFTYPDELDEYVQSSLALVDRRTRFGFSYRTMLVDFYELHVVYNAIFVPSDWGFSTIGDNLAPVDFSWNVSATPEVYEGITPTAHFVIDSREAHKEAVEALEDILYGSPTTEPRLPSIEEVVDVFEANALFIVIDHGDGSWTATGPDEMIQMLDATSFEITSPTAIPVSSDTYTLSSW